MSIEIKRLISFVEHMDIHLLAGENGQDRPVSWVHMVENLEASTFLEGGEVVFITGIGLSSPGELMSLVTELCKLEVSGIIINTGPYIEEIPADAIAYCDKLSIPLYEVPWKTHIAEIMRIFCFQITKSDRRTFEIAAGFKNAIFYPDQEQLYSIMLSQYHFYVEASYSVGVISVISDRDTAKTLEKFEIIFENHLRHYHSHFAVFINNDDIILVLSEHSVSAVHEIVNDLIDRAKIYLSNDEKLCVGVGRLTKSARCIYKSYRQAKEIQSLQAKGRIDPSQFYYSDMGLYRILMGVEDTEIIKEYHDAVLAPLLVYDKNNNTNLTQTLQTYLEKNGSVKETADAMYVHRNTINYSLKRIEEILNADMSSLADKLRFVIAFMLRDMI